ncbi:polyprenyl synthetase family protein [Actinocatenispora rupis]|uniref:Geranylgeranyl pyrophosphate synthase n=1 Tax=Actinocatenispora rupis TaxID=519421 RepID=A0A8J3IX28_9ACTN|nr:polyprenyl synthetase family protein [Actinocatenispora rupis]GID10268.1 geranylgeranyl pyrophosphate synthase [Actinocatenispora rupis]
MSQHLVAGVAGRVTGVLAEFLAAEVDTLRALDPAVADAAAPLTDLVLRGGKRLRPAFAYWGWRGVVADGADDEPVVRAVGALELLHAFALAHDDVMDASAVRRGRPTLHREFADRHRTGGWRGDPDRFGTSVAVLLGDLCAVWADRLIGTSGLPAPVLLAARRVYDAMRIEAVAGQYLDVLHAAGGSDGVAAAVKVARFKSASYTVQRPLRFGAALAGPVPPDAVAAYDRFGVAVGEAFQLRDDILGVYGETAVTGKPVGDDLRQGKPTVLAELARSRATPRQRALLDRTLGAADASDAELAEVTAVITACGARAEVEGMISARVSAGLAALAAAPVADPARRELSALALAAVQRAT